MSTPTHAVTADAHAEHTNPNPNVPGEPPSRTQHAHAPTQQPTVQTAMRGTRQPPLLHPPSNAGTGSRSHSQREDPSGTTFPQWPPSSLWLERGSSLWVANGREYTDSRVLCRVRRPHHLPLRPWKLSRPCLLPRGQEDLSHTHKEGTRLAQRSHSGRRSIHGHGAATLSPGILCWERRLHHFPLCTWSHSQSCCLLLAMQAQALSLTCQEGIRLAKRSSVAAVRFMAAARARERGRPAPFSVGCAASIISPWPRGNTAAPAASDAQ